jgi:type II secretory pathway component PulL
MRLFKTNHEIQELPKHWTHLTREDLVLFFFSLFGTSIELQRQARNDFRCDQLRLTFEHITNVANIIVPTNDSKVFGVFVPLKQNVSINQQKKNPPKLP